MAMFVREVPCDICDAVEDVNNFCVNCKQKYCDNCKKGHLRTAFTKHHRFVPIGDSLLASSTKDDLCAEHKEEKQFYCKTCSKTCCSECLSKHHRNHNFSPIHKLIEEIRNEIEEKLSLKEKDVSNIENVLKKYASVSQNYAKQSEEIISYIKKTIHGWMTDLKSFEDKLVDETRKATEVENRNIDVKAKELRSTREIYTKEIYDVRVPLRTSSDASLLEQKGSIMSRVDSIVVPLTEVANPVLSKVTLRQTSRQDVEHILRNVRSDILSQPNAMKAKETEAKVKPTIQKRKLLNRTKIENKWNVEESVHDIAPVSESKAWIGTRYNVMLVNTDGKILLQHPHGNTGTVVGMTVHTGTSVTSTPSGDALYVSNDTVINRIDQTGKVSEAVDIKANKIRCIRSSKLFSCIYAATDKCILRLSHDGAAQARMECSAHALTELTDGRLVVLDERKNFVLVNKNGDCKDMAVVVEWVVYRYITSLSSDFCDRIIIGDPRGNQLHVYEIKEEEIKLLTEQTVDMPVYRRKLFWDPYRGIYGVTTTSDGQVWIGTFDGDVFVAEYQE